MNPYQTPDCNGGDSMPRRRWLVLLTNLARVAILLALLLPVLYPLVFFAYGYHESHIVESFCDEAAQTDTREAIIERADARGLYRFDWQDTDDVWILNKPGPMFRFACTVKFRGGMVSEKTVIDAD